MDMPSFLVMLFSFTGAAVTVIGSIVWGIGYLKRQRSPSHLSTEELDELRARLAELEQRDLRVEEIAERLDFVERVLGRSQEPRPLPGPPDRGSV